MRRVEDRRRAPASLLVIGVERQQGCRARTAKPKTNISMLNSKQRDGVLLPVLRAGVEAAFEPASQRGASVTPVHDPGEVTAHRDRQEDRRDDDEQRQQPHGETLCSDHAPEWDHRLLRTANAP